MTWWTDDKGAVANDRLNPEFRPMTAGEETALLNAMAAAQASRAALEAGIKADAATLRGDADLRSMVGMNPAQIDAWVNANVTDLASARNAIRLLARGLSVLARREIG